MTHATILKNSITELLRNISHHGVATGPFASPLLTVAEAETVEAPAEVETPVQTPAVPQDPKFKEFLKGLTDDKAENQDKKPDNYAIILHNDATTPYQIVVHVLREVFGMSENRAQLIMMTAHHDGKCVVCILAEPEAEEKMRLARQASNGTELTFTMEKENDGE